MKTEYPENYRPDELSGGRQALSAKSSAAGKAAAWLKARLGPLVAAVSEVRVFRPLVGCITRVVTAFKYAADKKHHDCLFHWSVGTSMILLVLAAWLTEVFLPKDESLELFSPQKELLAISPHTLIVKNYVQRTSLAKRRIKVPKYKPTELALKEVEIPEPELGSLEVGPEVEEVTGPVGPGSPTGRARVRKPELMMLVPPVYPRDAEKKKIEGSVKLRIHVTTTGTVDAVQIVTSSGLKSMDDAAVKAAKKTRFRPGIKDGRRTPMWIYYPIQFALNRK